MGMEEKHGKAHALTVETFAKAIARQTVPMRQLATFFTKLAPLETSHAMDAPRVF